MNEELKQRNYQIMAKPQSPTLTHDDINRQIDEFFAKGGEVEKVEPGASGDRMLIEKGWVAVYRPKEKP